MKSNFINIIHNEAFDNNLSLEGLNIQKIYSIEDKAYLILLNSIDVYEIFEIAVSKKFRNQGLASSLMNMLPQDKDIFLEVRESNIPAINLYLKFGFEIISKRKFYYSNNETAIIMCKKNR